MANKPSVTSIVFVFMSKNNPSLNWQQLDQITDNDRDLAKEFVVMFLENATTYVDELVQALKMPDLEACAEFARVCHKLKGAANSVGAENIANLALQGEKTSKASEKLMNKECSDLIEMIKGELKSITRIIS